MTTDEPNQPVLPFEPPLQLAGSPDASMEELSFDRFAALLFEEVVRRSVALELGDRRQPRSAA
jgi:hypothetical protein